MHCCTVCLLLGKVIGVCRYWQALSNNTAGTIQWESFVGTLKIVFMLWFTCTLLYCHIPNIYVLCSSVSSFSVKAIRLPCPYIFGLLLTVRGLLQIDPFTVFMMWGDTIVNFFFLSPYTETAWSFLVWQTWDIFLRNSAQERLIFNIWKSFSLCFTLVLSNL